jgi:hypothetical protein
MLLVHRGSLDYHASFTVNFPETETMGLNNFTSVVGRVTSSKRLFYYGVSLATVEFPVGAFFI